MTSTAARASSLRPSQPHAAWLPAVVCAWRARQCSSAARVGLLASQAALTMEQGAGADFDVAQFESTLSLQALRVPKEQVHELCTVLRRLGALFDRPRLRAVVADAAAPDDRLVLLAECVHSRGARMLVWRYVAHCAECER